jgi:hypothetical protein
MVGTCGRQAWGRNQRAGEARLAQYPCSLVCQSLWCKIYHLYNYMGLQLQQHCCRVCTTGGNGVQGLSSNTHPPTMSGATTPWAARYLSRHCDTCVWLPTQVVDQAIFDQALYQKQVLSMYAQEQKCTLPCCVVQE